MPSTGFIAQFLAFFSALFFKFVPINYFTDLFIKQEQSSLERFCKDVDTYHFDRLMIFLGFWFKPLETYAFEDEVEEDEKMRNPEYRRKLRQYKYWCYVIVIGVSGITLLRWTACWFMMGPTGVHLVHNVPVILGGPAYVHNILLMLWSLHPCITIMLWWYMQYQDKAYLSIMLEPFIAIHFPQRAKQMG